MTVSPESAVNPVAQAPPDRPTIQLEQALNNVRAIIFGDGVMDQNEMALFRDFIEEVSMRAQAGGGLGQGGTPSPEGPPPGPSPMQSNQDQEDQYTQPGTQPIDEGS